MALNTEKLRLFVAGVVSGLKPKDACVAAGYAAAGAQSKASQLMARADVKAAIKRAKTVSEARGEDSEPSLDDEPKSIMKDKYSSSLELLRDLYNNPKASLGVRMEAAKLALPYEHAKKGELGKKEQQKKDAEEASGRQRGRPKKKFAPMGRPKLKLVG